MKDPYYFKNRANIETMFKVRKNYRYFLLRISPNKKRIQMNPLLTNHYEIIKNEIILNCLAGYRFDLVPDHQVRETFSYPYGFSFVPFAGFQFP
jgi:hypothetical protein